MPVNKENYLSIKKQLDKKNVTLVAVSKTKPAEDILTLYKTGQRDFGENYVQELLEKQEQLPKDIRWHFIGHLQSNKVKFIASFVHLIQGVDSKKLLIEINKQAAKCDRIIDCLLQVHIAEEETKFGFDAEELLQLWALSDEQNISVAGLKNIRVRGLMGMASLTTDMQRVRYEFRFLKKVFDQLKNTANMLPSFDILSMGMSADFEIAIDEGSNMVRIGSLLFGERK
jgi:PLP dependent protein